MHPITNSLFVGNVEEAQNPPAYVTGLLFVALEHEIDPPQGITFLRVPLKEFGEADPEDLRCAVEWLERSADSDRLLVCCRAGMGRSVSVVIAYLCCVRGMRYEEALQLCKARRPGATPLPYLEKTIQKVQELRQMTPGGPSGASGPAETPAPDMLT